MVYNEAHGNTSVFCSTGALLSARRFFAKVNPDFLQSAINSDKLCSEGQSLLSPFYSQFTGYSSG